MAPVQEGPILVVQPPEETVRILRRLVYGGHDDVGDHADRFDRQAAGHAEGECLLGSIGSHRVDCESDEFGFGFGFGARAWIGWVSVAEDALGRGGCVLEGVGAE